MLTRTKAPRAIRSSYSSPAVGAAGALVARFLQRAVVSLIALFAVDAMHSARAEQRTANIVGLGPTTCQRFSQEDGRDRTCKERLERAGRCGLSSAKSRPRDDGHVHYGFEVEQHARSVGTDLAGVSARICDAGLNDRRNCGGDRVGHCGRQSASHGIWDR